MSLYDDDVVVGNGAGVTGLALGTVETKPQSDIGNYIYIYILLSFQNIITWFKLLNKSIKNISYKANSKIVSLII